MGVSDQRRGIQRMKTLNRSVSVVADNYTPLTNAYLSEKHSGTLVINMDEPTLERRRSSPNVCKAVLVDKENENDFSREDRYFNYKTTKKKGRAQFQRGETFDNPSSFSSENYWNQFEESFDPKVSFRRIVTKSNNLLRATSSNDQFRGRISRQDIHRSSTHRNNKTNLFFHDTQKNNCSPRTCDITKSNSLSSEEHIFSNPEFLNTSQYTLNNTKLKRNSSIENDMYRPQSNINRSNFQLFENFPPNFIQPTRLSNGPNPIHYKETEQSKVHLQNCSPRLSTSEQNNNYQQEMSLIPSNYRFLSTEQPDDCKTFRKSHSVRYKQPRSRDKVWDRRDNYKFQKSKSFIYHENEKDYPYRMAETQMVAESVKPQKFEEEIQNLSTEGIMLETQVEPNFPKIEFETLGFNNIYQSYREKQKLSSSINKNRKRSSHSIQLKKNEESYQENSQLKRQKIACILLSLIFGLIIFVVITILYHYNNTSETQTNNQTRQSIILTRDSRPIHFGGGYVN